MGRDSGSRQWAASEECQKVSSGLLLIEKELVSRAGAAMNERKDSSEMNVLARAPAESLQRGAAVCSFIVIICKEPQDLISQPGWNVVSR